MDRKKIVDAILREYRQHGPRNQEHVLIDALKHVSDTNLIVYAQNLGIDTDAVLTPGLSEALDVQDKLADAIKAAQPAKSGRAIAGVILLALVASLGLSACGERKSRLVAGDDKAFCNAHPDQCTMSTIPVGEVRS